MIESFFTKIIKLYRKSFLSNLGYVFFGPSFGCRFHPTCSHYAQEAIVKHGTFKGSVKGLYRIIRCNPFAKGGVDLP